MEQVKEPKTLLIENTLEQFADILASEIPAPGGGSVAALNGTLAAALVKMACTLTLAKEKYREFHAEMREIAAAAGEEQKKLLAGIDEDTEAYNRVSAVFSMPKETPEQKASRSEAMQAALKGATEAPLATMKAAHKCLELAGKAIGKTNPSCASDFGSGIVCALASVRCAWLNVKINLSSVKDGDFAEKTLSEAREILNHSEELAGNLFGRIERGI